MYGLESGILMKKEREINVIDNVAGELIQRIKDGVYSIGDKLPTEKELCQMFEVSRSTLREAISIVRAKGYIETRHGSGSYVIATNVETKESVEEWFALRKSQLNDFFEVRCTVEVMNIRYAIMRRTDEDIERIKQIHNAFENAIMRGDAEKMSVLGEKFHRELARLCGNSLLIEMNRIIAKALRPYRRKSFGISENAIHALVPHGKIIQALEERDLGAGVQAVEEHIDGSLADIAAAAEKSGDERESSEVDVTK